jgi:hypothetical protein
MVVILFLLYTFWETAHPMQARVAVMHRLVKIAYGVVQSGEPYRGGRAALSAPT